MTDIQTAVSAGKTLSSEERRRLIFAPFPIIRGQARGHSQAPRLTLRRQHAEDGEFDGFNNDSDEGL